MDGTTDEIKARINIVELIGTYVRLEKAGAHYRALCPFHQERSPSFMVNEEKAMWHCFGCGKGGDAFAFIMEIEGLEFREALTLLASRAGVELPQYRGAEKSKENKEHLFALLELATKFYEKQLASESGQKKIAPYLKGRGLSPESIKKFRLGYAPDGWRHLLDFLVSRGFQASEIEQAGLVLKKEGRADFYDRFRDRIMFPIFDILGRIIGYSARVTPGGDETQAKYINTPETSVYHKSRALYGLFHAKQAMKQAGSTIIVEGNMDVIALHQAGVENTVAVSGTALTSEQLSLIKRYGNDVRLFFDMDGAGQKAARKSAELALEKEFLVSIIALPSGKDAADLGKEDGEKLRTAVASFLPALQYFLDESLKKNNQTTPEGKRKIVEEYTKLLLVVKNPIERAHWIKELARHIGMEEKMVIGVVNKSFVDQARSMGPSLPPTDPLKKNIPFGKRSELLREELIGLCYAEKEVRKNFLKFLQENDEIKMFLEKHPLFFFVLQAGEHDPLSLIEDTKLKSEATRLSFRALASPELLLLEPQERLEKMLSLSEAYGKNLYTELTEREKLLALEAALTQAREQKDKTLEKKILAEFVALSAKRFSSV